MKTQRLLPAAIALATASLVSSVQAVELEEIVVTAQKRAQDMQDVPIAVTAMSAEMIKEAGISNMKGIAVRTPGFSMGSFNPTQPQLYIRGIGSNGDGAGGGEQSVAMFVDGVYINRSAGTGTELYDLEAIEVLRGPQGTLWGKNAIAGAINVTTKRPSDSLEGALEVGVGNIGQRTYRGMVTGPLTENLNGKVSFNKKKQDAYVKSVIDSNIETGDIDSESFRTQFLFTPSDSVEVLLTADYSTDDRSGGAAVPASDVGLIGALLQADPALPDADFHENYMEDSGLTEMDSKGLSLQVDWDNDWGTLTSLTAYRKGNAKFENISFGVGLTAFPVVDTNNFADESSKMFSQELRLSGEGDNLQWQTGLYYNKEEVSRTEGGHFATAIDLGGFFSGAGINPLGFVAQMPDDVTHQKNTTTSVAAFGQGTYSVTEDLDVTVGVRFTREEKDFSNIGISGSGLYVLENYDIEAKETWTAPTYKLVANYHATDDTMVYASIASGFKSGGFDGTASTGAGAQTPFDEESAVNMELGFKSMLFDNRLRLNGAIFNTDYEDLQVLQAFPNGSPIPPLQTKNAGKANSRGVELEATLAVSENLRLNATYAYLDTEYKELDGSLEPHEGNSLRNAPENAYSFSATYEKPLSGGAVVSARAEYIAKDKAYQDVQNLEVAAIPSYRVTNLRFAVTTADEKWEVAAWANNVFDEEFYVHNYFVAPFGAINTPALPRTYGVNATYQF